MADFPSTIPSFMDLVDQQDDVLAVHQNNPNDEISAIATFIGNIGSGLTQASSTDILAFLLGSPTTFKVSYVDASTVQVSAGVALITNALASERVMRKNASTTNVTGADLDSGGPTFAVSTVYYLYAEGDSVGTSCDFVVSTSASTPAGYTRYLKIGKFTTDSSGNIVESSVLSTAIADAAPKGSVLQVQFHQRSDSPTGSTAIPNDNSKPQIGEGDEYLTKTVTFHNVNNKVRIDVIIYGDASAGGVLQAALFQDSGSDCIACGGTTISSGNLYFLAFSFEMAAGTLASTKFTVRAGGSAGTFTLNGSGGSGKYGGALYSSMYITEIKS